MSCDEAFEILRLYGKKQEEYNETNIDHVRHAALLFGLCNLPNERQEHEQTDRQVRDDSFYQRQSQLRRQHSRSRQGAA